jgi:hypothetical protein
MNITLCDCPICNEKDCKVCLEPQNCECNCGTCSDAKALYEDSISIENDPDEVKCYEMYLENLNDIEKDGKN